jgi:membrane protein YdbS with pleckstrin-like domain
MPVIACPDCGHDVSTLAPVCPNCGRPSPAGTTPITAATAPKTVAEETLWRGSPSAVKLVGRVLEIVLILIIIPTIAHYAAQASTNADTGDKIIVACWWITAILVLIEVVRFFTALAKLRSTVYTITNQRVMIERGLLSKNLSEIDLRYIDDTQFSQGLFDRMLGVGNVTIISSDKSTPLYVLQGVRDPRTLRELIRSNSYQVSQRQIFTRAT